MFIYRRVSREIMNVDSLAQYPELQTLVEHSGWYPGRRVSVDAWIQDLSRDGFTLSSRVIEFLQDFGGLTIPATPNPKQKCCPESVICDPTWALERYNDDDIIGRYDIVGHFEKRLNTQLTPCAYFGQHPTLCLLSRKGWGFGEWDSALYSFEVVGVLGVLDSVVFGRNEWLRIGDVEDTDDRIWARWREI